MTPPLPPRPNRRSQHGAADMPERVAGWYVVSALGNLNLHQRHDTREAAERQAGADWQAQGMPQTWRYWGWKVRFIESSL